MNCRVWVSLGEVFNGFGGEGYSMLFYFHTRRGKKKGKGGMRGKRMHVRISSEV